VISEAFAAVPATIGFSGRSALDESDEALDRTRHAVARAKRGDQDALRFLYVAYSNNIYGYVRSILRDDHEAEDVTQHVFAKLMTTLGKYDDRGLPFFAWLLRMARNVAIDHLRANRLTPSKEVISTDLSSGFDIVRSEDALATLPEEQRAVVVLHHLVGITPGEIADRLGRIESSVRGLHHRVSARVTARRGRTVYGSRPRRAGGLISAGLRGPGSRCQAPAGGDSAGPAIRPQRPQATAASARARAPPANRWRRPSAAGCRCGSTRGSARTPGAVARRWGSGGKRCRRCG